MEHCAFEAPEEYHIDHTSFIKLQLIYFDERCPIGNLSILLTLL